MPADIRRAIEEEQENEGFMRQLHISQRNILRLRELCSGGAPGIRVKAARVLEIALVAPYKRRRSGILRRTRFDFARDVHSGDLQDDPDPFDTDDQTPAESRIPDNVPPDLDLWEGQDSPESLSGVYDRDAWEWEHRASGVTS